MLEYTRSFDLQRALSGFLYRKLLFQLDYFDHDASVEEHVAALKQMYKAKRTNELVGIKVERKRPVSVFDPTRARRVGEKIAGILKQVTIHLGQETNPSVIEAFESVLWYIAYCGVYEVEFDGQVEFLNGYFTISALTYPDSPLLSQALSYNVSTEPQAMKYLEKNLVLRDSLAKSLIEKQYLRDD